jgi:hypothetical protein
MGAQTTYKFFPSKGVAGGIVNLQPYAIDSYVNEEPYGVMEYGVGVVPGTTDKQIKLPTSSSTAAQFLGVTVNNRTTEYNIMGELDIWNKYAVGVMRYGRIYVKVKVASESGGVKTYTNVATGDPAYMIITGSGNIGRFTNQAGLESTPDGVAINARFASAQDENGIAQLDILDSFAP